VKEFLLFLLCSSPIYGDPAYDTSFQITRCEINTRLGDPIVAPLAIEEGSARHEAEVKRAMAGFASADPRRESTPSKVTSPGSTRERRA
jgi:hypothetical protein